MGDAAVICYGVINVADADDGQSGLRGAQLRPICNGALALLTSALPADAFAGASQEQIGEAAQQFHATLNRWSSGCDILPMRFGTLFDQESDALRYLASNAGALSTALAGISGMQEWQVSLASLLPDSPEPHVEAQSYLRALQAQRAQRKTAHVDVAGHLEALAEVLQTRGARSCECVMSSHATGMLTALWPRGQAGAFMGHINAYADRSSGVSFEVVGPEAPFTYAAQSALAHAA